MKITREYLLKVGGWAALKEADALLAAGKVGAVTYEPPFLEGKVQVAQGSVAARLKVSERLFEVENLCSCRQARVQGIICAHVLALGLRHLAPAPVTATVVATSPQVVPIPMPPRPSRFEAASEGVESPLEIAFLLPLDLPASWRAGLMRVIVEAAIPRQASRPLDVVLKTRAGSIPVLEEALGALQFLERRAKEPLPSMWLLTKIDYEGFFSALIGCPTVSLGKKSSLSISAGEENAELHLQTDAEGRLRLELNESATSAKGEWLSSARGRWLFTGAQLIYQAMRGPVLQQLTQGAVVLQRPEVPRFLREELPALSAQVTVTRCARTEQIELQEEPPRFRVTLDGTSASLSCRLEVCYGATSHLLSGSPRAQVTAWSPDAQHPLRYLARSARLETQAQQTLIEAGFVPGSKQPEFYVLSGENVCLRFLANDLPAWQASWEVQVQPRLQSFLGQCTWIEPEAKFTSSGLDWLQVEIDYRSAKGGETLTAGEVQNLLQTGRCSQRLKSGRIALIPSDTISAWQETLQDCDEEAGTGSVRVGAQFAPYLHETLGKFSRSAWTPPTELLQPTPLQLPAPLDSVLRPYQQQGVEWMAYLARNKFSGVLADEMGLGKTLQTLAYLLFRRRATNPAEPALIVCPTSLLTNWAHECQRFTPELKCLVLHGSDRHQHAPRLSDYDLLITSYALIRRDAELYRARTFDAVVLDEAQQIKNRFSQSAQAVKALSANYRLILTGTPMENSLLDLWSIFDFLMPGYLGTARSFKERYEEPITKRQDRAAQTRLSQRLKPFVLRRTKKEVAPELPPKLETILYAELSEEQKSVYQQILNQGRREVFDLAGKGDQGKRTMAMLTTLTRLRQVSCHLGLLPTVEGKTWEEPSAKLELMMETLSEAIEGGHRVLVFSQFVKLLRLIETRLSQDEIRYCYLDGATEDRAGEVARFQNTPAIPVFLISLKAGGTGLNLTGADTVIHCDPWWNPAVEEQATARAHRIGQERLVNSYKLIARGTVEEKILELQSRKRELLSQTLFQEQSLVASLNSEEWQDLLAMP